MFKTLKEEEYQDGFLRDVFVDVLGYTLKPDAGFNLMREFKNLSDSKKADGAVLKDNKAHAVIELKSTKTKDLKSITEQAFNYKNNQPGCKYVITSNFQKLRFYIDYANEYEEFDLFHLNKEDFERMFLIFCRDSILNDTPEKLKKESISHEENVSKRLYTDYSVSRKKIFENLAKNNPDIDQLILFGKAQKLIDRFLFILFAEDKGLLPPNAVRRIIERFHTLKEEDAYKPLYEILKQFFGYMNTGRPGKKTIDDIPAYNGGLFYPDEVMYSLKIDDDVLVTDLQKLSAYDFDTEVDVNILGHIFEHSLSEIEETTARIKGIDIDKTKSRRKKDGIFYTPQYITQYIVENTIGRLCGEKRKELDIVEIEVDDSYYTKKGDLSKKGGVLYQKIEDYKNWLLSLKILDPACGSGAFLNQALNFLIREHQFIVEIQTDLKKGQVSMFNFEAAVLENNLYGVDINEESVEITKLSLWLRTAHRNRKLSNLSSNIRCGNSLIDDPEIAGDKAFNWEKEFPRIMENGGFDVVIGNPPYIPSRSISESYKNFYYQNYKTSEYQLNTFGLFIEKALKLICENSYYCQIIPNYWLSTRYDEKLRNHVFLTHHALEILNVFNIFEDATVDTLIITGQKKKSSDFPHKTLVKNISPELTTIRDRLAALRNQNWHFDGEVLFDENSDTRINFDNKTVVNGKYTLSDFLVFKKGMQPYEKGKGNPPQDRVMMKNNVYDAKFKIDETYEPLLRARNIRRYLLLWENDWIKYGHNLAAPRTKSIFEGERILVRRVISNEKLEGTYISETFINNTDIINVLPKDSDINLKSFSVIIMSKLCANFLKKQNINLNRKAFPKINVETLKTFPVPEISAKQHIRLAQKADIMLTKNKELHELKADFLSFFKSELTPQKISQKLENWNELDREQFTKEMEKCKVKDLCLKVRKEWHDYFIEHKEKADKIKSVIDTTEKEIDRLVYELYGLTDEEIAIVENG